MIKLFHSLAEIVKSHKPFFILYATFLFGGAIWLLIYDKGDMVLMMNELHGGIGDSIFIIFSNAGEGQYFAIVIVLFGLFRFRNFFFGLTAFLGSGIVVQILKALFNNARPKSFFEDIADLSFVAGVNVHSWYSMPSGHSASGFVIFLFFAFMIKDKRWSALMFLLALMVGLSRVYLVQHFFVDIYFGSMIGTLSALYFYYLFFVSDKLKNNTFLDKSLVNLRKNKP